MDVRSDVKRDVMSNYNRMDNKSEIEGLTGVFEYSKHEGYIKLWKCYKYKKKH